MIKLASPDITDSDIQRAVDVIKSGNLVQGDNVISFETGLKSFTGLPEAVVLSSGTAALHLSLLALGIGPGDFVIVPAFTFPATANVVEVAGAEIILTDVDKTTYVMTPEDLEKAILHNSEKNIKAVIVVHEFGYPARIKEISEITRKYNLLLIEDAACALGTIADGFHVGYYGDIACFSFHPRKAITTGEGGAVITKNAELADKVRFLRNHGIQYNDTGMDFLYAGLNYRMTDFQAALAIGQLERFNNELDKRRLLALKYYELLDKETCLTLPGEADGHSWQSFMVVLDQSIDRKKLIEALLEKGIQANLGAQAINSLMYYKNKYNYDKKLYTQASNLFNYGLVLPLYGKLKSGDVEYITGSLIDILSQ